MFEGEGKLKNLSSNHTNMLVGSAFEDLSLEEMAITQGGAAKITTSSAACLKTVTVSSGWCSAGVVVSTVVYSVMKC